MRLSVSYARAAYLHEAQAAGEKYSPEAASMRGIEAWKVRTRLEDKDRSSRRSNKAEGGCRRLRYSQPSHGRSCVDYGASNRRWWSYLDLLFLNPPVSGTEALCETRECDAYHMVYAREGSRLHRIRDLVTMHIIASRQRASYRQTQGCPSSRTAGAVQALSVSRLPRSRLAPLSVPSVRCGWVWASMTRRVQAHAVQPCRQIGGKAIECAQ